MKAQIRNFIFNGMWAMRTNHHKNTDGMRMKDVYNVQQTLLVLVLRMDPDESVKYAEKWKTKISLQ